MNDPFRGTSLAERMGPSQFDVGSMRVLAIVDIALAIVKHTPMGKGRTSGVYKDDRPVSFFFVPSVSYKWQVQNKVSAVWCKRFNLTIEDFLRDVFCDPTERRRPCAVADYISNGGRAVQLWNSIRYLETSCRLCRAMSEKEIGEVEGNALFRLLFAQTGWLLLEPGMKKATEGVPSFVQRSSDGRTISAQWVSGIARILATMPANATEGPPQKMTTRGMVRATKGTYAYLGGA